MGVRQRAGPRLVVVIRGHWAQALQEEGAGVTPELWGVPSLKFPTSRWGHRCLRKCSPQLWPEAGCFQDASERDGWEVVAQRWPPHSGSWAATTLPHRSHLSKGECLLSKHQSSGGGGDVTETLRLLLQVGGETKTGPPPPGQHSSKEEEGGKPGPGGQESQLECALGLEAEAV